MRETMEYWLKTAEHDHETMSLLYDNSRYSDALFFGHIVIEKLLKGLVVKNTNEHAPFTHDLVQLQKISGVSMTNEEIDLLDEINDFNIRARYPEQKLAMHKRIHQWLYN